MSTSINSLIATAPKLNGDNYHEWVFDIKMIAMRAGTWDVLSGKAQRPIKAEDLGDWDKLDRDAYTMIGLTVARSELTHIRACKTAYEMWKALEDIYARSSRANRIALRQQLGAVTLVDDKVQDYVNQITDIAARLRAMGVTLDDQDEIDVLIMNLPNTWGHVASSLMIRPGDLKVKEVVAVLLEEEMRRRHEETHAGTQAMLAKASGKRGKVRTGSADSRTCYQCQKRGHMAQDCEAPAPVPRSKESNKEHAAIAANDEDWTRKGVQTTIYSF